MSYMGGIEMTDSRCPYCHAEGGKHECNCWDPRRTETCHDIVERLRGRLEPPDLAEAALDAADEIERLRERVAELEKECLDRGRLIKALSKPERLRQACDGYLGELAAMRANKDEEIERLRERVAEAENRQGLAEHMQANLHSHIKRLEDENADLKQRLVAASEHDMRERFALRAENAKLREALEEE